MSGRRSSGAVVRLPISRMGGPAFSEAGLAGVGLYVALLMWSRRHEEDGRVPKIVAETLFREHLSAKPMAKLIGRLIKAGLLERDGEDYRLVGYAAFAETKAQIKAESSRTAKRARAARLRPSVLQRDGLRCHICGGDVLPRDVHVDHVHPLARGGESDAHNLRVSHSRCNLLKGAS